MMKKKLLGLFLAMVIVLSFSFAVHGGDDCSCDDCGDGPLRMIAICEYLDYE